jgi:malonate transporter and related proteins
MMGIPIVVAAFGAEALAPLLGIITIHSAIILPLATVLIEFGGAKDGRRGGGHPLRVLRVTGAGLLRNPVIMTMVLAFAWRGLGLGLPEVLHGFFRLIGSAGPPLALFCLGAALPPLAAGAGVIREVLLACLLRLVLTPGLMLGAGWWLGMQGTAFKVAVLVSGMPTGANAFLLARRTATAAEASASTVVVATAASLFSLSLLLAALR